MCGIFVLGPCFCYLVLSDLFDLARKRGLVALLVFGFCFCVSVCVLGLSSSWGGRLGCSL